MSAWRPGHVQPFRYRDFVAPEGYVCTHCGRSGVKLWRDAHIDTATWCVVCLAALPPAGWKPFSVADVHANGKTLNENENASVFLAWKLPYIPTEEGDETWGHPSGEADSASWWRQLPLLEGRPVPEREITVTTPGGDVFTYVRQDVVLDRLLQKLNAAEAAANRRLSAFREVHGTLDDMSELVRQATALLEEEEP